MKISFSTENAGKNFQLKISTEKLPLSIWGNCSSGDEQAVLHSQSFFEFELQPLFSHVNDLFPFDDLQ